MIPVPASAGISGATSAQFKSDGLKGVLGGQAAKRKRAPSKLPPSEDVLERRYHRVSNWPDGCHGPSSQSLDRAEFQSGAWPTQFGKSKPLHLGDQCRPLNARLGGGSLQSPYHSSGGPNRGLNSAGEVILLRHSSGQCKVKRRPASRVRSGPDTGAMGLDN